MSVAQWDGTGLGPVIQIGYPAEHGPEFRWDSALWDTTGRWAPWWDWRSIECDVQAGSSIVRGSASPGEQPSSGTASLVITPRDATLSPWWVDGTGSRPNRANLPLRVGVQDIAGGDVWWLFTGWVDYLSEIDSPDEHTITLVASDGFKHLANLEQEPVAATGAGEAAGTRIKRLLERGGWQNAHDLSSGTISLQATTMEQAVLEEIHFVADTEAGVVWVDTQGTFRFGDRDWLRMKAESADWYVGDGTVIGGVVCASSIVTTADDMDVQNVIGVSRVGGTPQWVEDEESIAKYGRHSWSRLDLPYADDADTATILALQLADRTARDYHVQAVVLSPLDEPAAWDVVLGVDLYDTVHVSRTRYAAFAEAASVIGVDHSFGPGEFVTVLSLGPRVRQTLARWDTDVWDTGRWSGT